MNESQTDRKNDKVIYKTSKEDSKRQTDALKSDKAFNGVQKLFFIGLKI